MSFALKGRFLTTGPSEKSLFSPAFYYYYYYYWLGLDLYSCEWAFSSYGEWGLLLASCCGGFSCRGAQALGT